MKIHNLTKNQQILLLNIFKNDNNRYVIKGIKNIEALKTLFQLNLVEEADDDDTYTVTNAGKEHLLSYNFIDDTDTVTDFGNEFLSKKTSFKDYLETSKR